MLAQSLLLDLTLRYTKANEFGLLGFGGDRKQSRSVEPTAAARSARLIRTERVFTGRCP